MAHRRSVTARNHAAARVRGRLRRARGRGFVDCTVGRLAAARLDAAFAPLDYFESKNVPFIVAVNEFEGGAKYPLHEVAEALALPDDVPLITLDARDRDSAKRALIRITEFALTRLAAQQRTA